MNLLDKTDIDSDVEMLYEKTYHVNIFYICISLSAIMNTKLKKIK